ncbi:putative orfan [Tupanvirus soda lake]|uniref:Orfan n=2 Tax=Tupanvirus TaxID=2094720 RepID=A0AC62AD76_9VIRU|nr:putative orfan [Tupanvirus soda lake]QKU35735.1 putative orfan [Tupanvirus soda lake]
MDKLYFCHKNAQYKLLIFVGLIEKTENSNTIDTSTIDNFSDFNIIPSRTKYECSQNEEETSLATTPMTKTDTYANINEAIKDYIKNKYQSDVTFTDTTPTDVQANVQMASGYYVICNKLYKKIVTRYEPGYIYNTYESTFYKIGSFCLEPHNTEYYTFVANKKENCDLSLANISNIVSDIIAHDSTKNISKNDHIALSYSIWSTFLEFKKKFNTNF